MFDGSNSMHADRNNRAFQVGLVGAGIQHSSSPSMHVDEGEALGLKVSYELLARIYRA